MNRPTFVTCTGGINLRLTPSAGLRKNNEFIQEVEYACQF
jgi:hypothetical protein